MTPEQAKRESYFHENGGCFLFEGERGGLQFHFHGYTRQGKTKLWVTRPTEFRVPIRHGMYGYNNYITEVTYKDYHLDTECQVIKELRKLDKNARYIGLDTCYRNKRHGMKVLIEQ